MVYLVPLAFLVLLGGMFFFLQRAKKASSHHLEQLSRENNWVYTEKSGSLEGLFQLTGSFEERATWSLAAFAKSSSNRNAVLNVSGEYTEWSIPISFAQTQLYLIPIDPSMKTINEEKWLSMLIPMWKQMGIPADNWSIFPLANEEIQQAYLLLGNDAQAAKKISDPVLRPLLQHWSKMPVFQRPSFRWDEGNLSIQRRKVLQQEKEILDMISWGKEFFQVISI